MYIHTSRGLGPLRPSPIPTSATGAGGRRASGSGDVYHVTYNVFVCISLSLHIYIYIYTYIHNYVYIYIYIYIHVYGGSLEIVLDKRYRCLRKKTLLLREPFPCKAAAETALLPLMLCV